MFNRPAPQAMSQNINTGAGDDDDWDTDPDFKNEDKVENATNKSKDLREELGTANQAAQSVKSKQVEEDKRRGLAQMASGQRGVAEAALKQQKAQEQQKYSQFEAQKHQAASAKAQARAEQMSKQRAMIDAMAQEREQARLEREKMTETRALQGAAQKKAWEDKVKQDRDAADDQFRRKQAEYEKNHAGIEAQSRAAREQLNVEQQRLAEERDAQRIARERAQWANADNHLQKRQAEQSALQSERQAAAQLSGAGHREATPSQASGHQVYNPNAVSSTTVQANRGKFAAPPPTAAPVVGTGKKWAPKAAPPPVPAPRAPEPEPEPEPEPVYEETYEPEPAYEEPVYEEAVDQPAYEEPAYEETYQEETSSGAYLFSCTATYEFAGENEGDLSFAEGDIINVIDDSDPDGWWNGELNGVVGVFPSNFVERN